MLHLLSQDRHFSVQLNTKFDPSVLGSIANVLPSYTSGCYADFLFLSIYTILATTSTTRSQILNLQESYLVTMANISPLIRSFAAPTANKLVSLFNTFSSPAFLLGKKHNHRSLFHIIYILNTILQYQYSGNSQLVYSLVRNRKKINLLDKLDYDAAIAYVNVNRVPADEKGKAPLTAYTSPSGFTPTYQWVSKFNYSSKLLNRCCPCWFFLRFPIHLDQLLKNIAP
jgi:High-temperature-induced dauer-formation protein